MRGVVSSDRVDAFGDGVLVGFHHLVEQLGVVVIHCPEWEAGIISDKALDVGDFLIEEIQGEACGV